MAAQQRKHPIFWLNFPAQHATEVGKADEAFQQVRLSVQMPHCLRHGIQRLSLIHI